MLAFNLWFGEETLGPWGDFFGGVLNLILTFLMFMGVLCTIVLQQAELRATRKELEVSAEALSTQAKSSEKQVFEAAFFQMLSIHNEIVDSIICSSTRKNCKGRDAVDLAYNEGFAKVFEHPAKIETIRFAEDDREKVETSYDYFWEKNSKNFGHYFRFLYNTVKFIDESRFYPISYIRLLRAQLSN